VSLPDESESWKFYSSDIYVSLTYEEEVVGFCKPDFAARIVEVLNDDEKLRQALWIACSDLARLSGGTSIPVDALVDRYLAKTAEPRSGTAAIVTLLRQRQEELDVSDKEFARFCDSYRLSQEQLRALYAGDDVDSDMLVPLSRILGRSLEDLLQLLEGVQEV
jgi:hypothetical protein